MSGGMPIKNEKFLMSHLRLKFTLPLFLFVFFMSGCVTTKPVNVSIVTLPELTEIVSLKSLCDRHQVQWSWDSISQVFVLKANHLEARGLIGSNIVLIGDEKVVLSEPVEIEKSAIMVPYDFNRKVMSRMVAPGMLSFGGLSERKIKNILIDPGHGGKDPGAIGARGTKEKDVVLSIARQLSKLLRARGFHVEMTRKDDRFVSLKERTEIASRAKADLFISIHANASKMKKATGIEVYSLRNLSVSEINSKQRKRNQYLLFRNFSMKPDNTLKSILSDILYKHKCLEDDLLAAYAAKKLSVHARAKNRGDKKSGYFVLKNTIMPSILIEVGFLSNPREEELLKSKAYQLKMARSLAQVIIDYNEYSDDELCRIVDSEY